MSQMQMQMFNNPNGQQYGQQYGQPQPNFQMNQTLGDLNVQPNPINYQGPYQPDPYAQQQQINMGISQGFSQFLWTPDPNSTKSNVPIKKQSSMHIGIIVSTLILIGGVAAGVIIVFVSKQALTGGVVIIAVSYVAYLICSIACSSIRGYISNLKKFEQYKQTYEKMIKGRGYFKFWIQCYHYKTTSSRKGGSTRKKVVTHTATQNFYPQVCIDESGNVEGIKDVSKYIFINYLKKFYFGDTRSDDILKNAYNSFVQRNRRDQYQNHTNTFQIEGFQPEVGFCMQGESTHNSIVFYVLSALGMALPYSCILERSVSRYQINILKRISF